MNEQGSERPRVRSLRWSAWKRRAGERASAIEAGSYAEEGANSRREAEEAAL